MNLILKIEKQKNNYLNYSKAVWDCFGFHIAQVGNIIAESGNIALLGSWPRLLIYIRCILILHFDL